MTVLIVDDEKLLLDAIMFEFELCEIESQGASSAREALEILDHTPIDVVVTDVRMPDMDGVDLLEIIRKRNHGKPPVIFISGFTDIKPDEAYYKGVNAFLTKPFEPESLVAVVKKYMEPSSSPKTDKDINSVKILELEPENIDFMDQSPTHEQIQLGRGGAFVPCECQDFKVGGKIVLSAISKNGIFSRLEIVSTIRWIRTKPDNQSEISGVGVEFDDFIQPSYSEFINKMTEFDPLPFIPRGLLK